MRPGVLFLLACFILLCGRPEVAFSQTPVAEVSQRLDELHHWLGDDANAQSWRQFLRSDDLASQLAKGNGADAATIEAIRAKYGGSEFGLDKPRFAAMRTALDKWLAELRMPTSDLPAAVRAAKDTFKPVTPETVAQKREQLLNEINRLDRWLQSSSHENANAWKSHLEWDALQKELANSEGARPEELERIAAIYRADVAGLEKPRFIAARRALRNYAQTLRLAADPKAAEAFAGHVEDLEKRLQALTTTPKLEDVAAAGQALGWLERAGQAPQIVSAMRDRFHRPNVFAQASQSLVEAVFDDPVAKAKLNEPRGNSDNILGTSIHGTVYPNLRMSVLLVPDDERAAINVQINGAAASSNVGYNGPVTVWTNGYTSIAASKYIYFDADGLTTSGTGASCATSSTIQSIQARCRLIEKMAWKRAGKQQGEAEAIASQHAQAKISGQVDSEMNHRLAEANQKYNDNFRNRLVRRDSLPRVFDVSSTADAIVIEVMHATPNQLTTATEPPQLSGKHDLALRLHETGVVNFGESLLGGETLTDERLVELLEEAKAEIPEELKITEDKDPWSITFSYVQPVSAEFAGNTVKISIRGRQFRGGDTVVRAEMRISAVYNLEKAGSGSKLTRQGEVTAEYVNLTQRQSIGQTAMKELMRKKFSALFKPEITSDGLKLPDRLKGVGKLQLQQLNADQGWLTLGWTQGEPAKVAANPTVEADVDVALAQ